MGLPGAEGDESAMNGVKAANMKGLDNAADEVPLGAEMKSVDADGVADESIDQGRPSDVGLTNGVAGEHGDI